MLLTQIIDEPKKKKAARPKHHADRYWHIARSCGGAEPTAFTVSGSITPSDRCPRCLPGRRVRAGQALAGRALSKNHGARLARGRLFVGDCRNGKRPQLAAEILQGFGGSAEDLTGKTSLDELIERLRKLRVLLTNDTGTMHLADGLGDSARGGIRLDRTAIDWSALSGKHRPCAIRSNAARAFSASARSIFDACTRSPLKKPQKPFLRSLELRFEQALASRPMPRQCRSKLG